MKTVLVTGVAGLIGSNFSHWLLNNTDVEVVGIDNLSGGWRENVPSHKRMTFYQLSVENDLIDIFERHRPNIVYHFSAYAAEGLSPFIRKFNYINNTVATANVVNCCITYEIERLVFTSSMAVYGGSADNRTNHLKDVIKHVCGRLPSKSEEWKQECLRGLREKYSAPPFDENRIPNPVDPYGVAKYACEMDIQIAGEQHGLDWHIIRPHNVYGNRQILNDPYRNVLGIWMYNVLNGLPITIYGDGMQIRAFTYIDDILPCLWTSGVEASCSREIVNLGGIEKTTILQAAETLQEVIRRQHLSAEMQFLPRRHEVKHAYSTHQKSIDLLNFQHKTSLKEGIEKMWEWAQTQPTKPRQIWSGYEIEKGIYPYWKQDALQNGHYKGE